MSNLIVQLHQEHKTVFTVDDLRIVWQEPDSKKLKSKIHYYTDSGQLIRLSKGVYALDGEYNTYELATSIYTPSYISFETVLRSEGLIFQHYTGLFVATYLSREVEVKNQKLMYRKIKQEVLVNPEGIIQKEGYAIASRERALLDMLYVDPNFYFDNLSGIHWQDCHRLVDMYTNKSLKARMTELESNAK
jgi:predicted transcriptional regulator of viral defense system